MLRAPVDFETKNKRLDDAVFRGWVGIEWRVLERHMKGAESIRKPIIQVRRTKQEQGQEREQEQSAREESWLMEGQVALDVVQYCK